MKTLRAMRWYEAAIAALCVLVAVAGSASALEKEEHGDDLPQTTDAEQLALEAELLSSYFDLSPEDSLERAEMRRVFGELLEKMASEHRDVFAGAQVRYEDPVQFTLYLAGDTSAAVRSLVDSPTYRSLPLAVIDGREKSLQQLEDDAAEAHRVAVDDLGRRHVTSWVDVTTGTVHLEVGVESDEAELAVSRSLDGLLAPDVVVTMTEPSMAASNEHTYGGALTTTSSTGTSGCTTAFKVQGSGTTGILTAGHCNNTRWYNMGTGNNYSMTYQTQHKGTWGDFQWHTTGHTEYDDFYFNWGVRRDTWGFRSANNIAYGDVVSGFGRVSGAKSASVIATNVTRTVGSNTYGRQVRLNQDVFVSGDSGAPWFVGGEAWGVHGGNCSGTDCFSPVAYVDEALGVAISTS